MDLHTWDPAAVETHDVIAYPVPRGQRNPELVVRAIDGAFQAGTHAGGVWIGDSETLDEALARAGYQRIGAWEHDTDGTRSTCRARVERR